MNLYTNNFSTTLTVSASAISTTLTVADASAVPVGVSATDPLYITLQSEDLLTIEVCKCIGVAGNVLTVERGQDGTSAAAFNINAYVEGRLTRAQMEELPQLGADNHFTQYNRFDGVVDFGDPGFESGGILVNGTTFPAQVKVNRFNSGGPAAELVLHRHSNVDESHLVFSRSLGTDENHVDVAAGNSLGDMIFTGWNTNSYWFGATIRAGVDGTPGLGSMPTRLDFSTAPAGTAAPVIRFTIRENGLVEVANDISMGVNTITDAKVALWDAAEPGLGNPTVDGYVLSSTIAGVRSWVEMTGGSGQQVTIDVAGISAANAGGTNAVAVGNATQAVGVNTIAIGNNAVANAASSITIGADASTGVELNSIAIGAAAVCEHLNSISLGQGAQCNGDEAVAIGQASVAMLDRGTTIGTLSRATSDSVAVGHNADATAFNSIAIGSGVQNALSDSISIFSSNANGFTVRNDGQFELTGISAVFVVPDYLTGGLPTTPPLGSLAYDTQTNELKIFDVTWNAVGGGGGLVAWGDITGTLSNQTDLQAALDAKENGLGNPVGDGYLLSSTIAGVRSWIPNPGAGTGEANTSSNQGAGEGLALPKVGLDLPFKTLVAGLNVTLTPGADTITIAAAAAGGISAVVDDTSPQLGGDLDVNGFNIVGPPAASATSPGGDLDLLGADGGATSGAGGNIKIQGGANNSSGGAGNGGDVTINGGSSLLAPAGSRGGAVILEGGGDPFSGGCDAGFIQLNGGSVTGTGAQGGDILLNPGNGDGIANKGHVYLFTLEATQPTELRFSDANTQASEYIGLRAPASLTASRTWVLPNDDPAVVNGQYLTTDASGNLSFAPGAGGGIGSLVEDTSPQLGGDLDPNGFDYLLDSVPTARGSRTLLTNKNANNTTTMHIAPSGTGSEAYIEVHSDSAISNGSAGFMGIAELAGEMWFGTTSHGTGTTRPMCFRADNTEGFRMLADASALQLTNADLNVNGNAITDTSIISFQVGGTQLMKVTPSGGGDGVVEVAEGIVCNGDTLGGNAFLVLDAATGATPFIDWYINGVLQGNINADTNGFYINGATPQDVFIGTGGGDTIAHNNLQVGVSGAGASSIIVDTPTGQASASLQFHKDSVPRGLIYFQLTDDTYRLQALDAAGAFSQSAAIFTDSITFQTGGTGAANSENAVVINADKSTTLLGDLEVNALGKEFRGDFSNADPDLRLSFVTSTANSATGLVVKPSGSGIDSYLSLFNANVTTNAEYLLVGHDGTQALVGSQALGTGTPDPLALRVGVGTGLVVDTDLTVSIPKTVLGSVTSVSAATGAAAVPNDTQFTVIDTNNEATVTITLTEPAGPTQFTYKVTGAAAATLTWASSGTATFKWAGGNALTAPAAGTDYLVSAFFDGTNWYLADTGAYS